MSQPYPRQPHEGTPAPPRRRRILVLAAVAVAVLAGMAALVGLFIGLLWAVNPMGDEWICSEGETPAGPDGVYSQCFDDDATLPKGYEWDPFGNRPMPYNCDKDGWLRIERPMPGQPGETEEDCVREGTDLPGSWQPVPED